MSVGTGSESYRGSLVKRIWGCVVILMRLWRQITYSITNLRLTPSTVRPADGRHADAVRGI